MIPEISWHSRNPVLSVDVQYTDTDFYRLATGGADYHVLVRIEYKKLVRAMTFLLQIWYVRILENGAVSYDVVADLTKHQRTVNCVRWSPNNLYLASADDDANIIIWNQKTDNIPLLEGDTDDKEVWIVNKVVRVLL